MISNKSFKILTEADGIVLSTPTYAAAPSAMIKNLIDRLGMFEYMTASTFSGKYVVTMATAKSFGAKKAASYLANITLGGIFGKAYVTGILGVILRGGKGASGHPDYMNKARKLGMKMVNDYEYGKKYPMQNFVARYINDHLMKPLITKGVIDYKEKEMRGVYQNLKERGLIK